VLPVFNCFEDEDAGSSPPSTSTTISAGSVTIASKSVVNIPALSVTAGFVERSHPTA